MIFGMGFFARHRYGSNDGNPALSTLDDLLSEVDEDPSDTEHVGVGVVHDSEWAVEVYSGWTVTFENVEDRNGAPRHIDAGTDREYVLRLMRAAAEGDLELRERQPWKPGYGSSDE
jgi:hypothetical protein